LPTRLAFSVEEYCAYSLSILFRHLYLILIVHLGD
jgi:hypothetical protein